MEHSKIIYQGVNNRNDEYLSTDGELSAAINLINDTGAYRAIKTPDKLLTLNEGERVLYIHKNLEYEHYIILSKTGLYYLNTTDSSDTERNVIQLKSYSLETPPQISSIGNTLIIRDTESLEYALFKSDCYLPLGNKPPVANISFGLSGHFTASDEFTIIDESVDSDIIPASARNGNFSLEDVSSSVDDDDINDYISLFTEYTLAEVNKFINEKVTEENKFIFPFFIRYAYRMYDGTHFMHSHPILMIPSTDNNPIVFIQDLDCSSGDSDETDLNIIANVSAHVCDIKYKLNNYLDELTGEITDSISNWSELITNVDIFISSPSYSYNQNGEVYGWTRLEDENDTLGTYSVGQLTNCIFGNMNGYQKYDYTEQFMLTQGDFNFSKDIDCITTTFASTTVRYPRYYMTLPLISSDTRTNSICNESLFYKIASLKFDELEQEFTTLEISDDIITNLVQQEQLDDEYKSHAQITSASAYTYNSRLNLGNITEHIYNGMPPNTQFTYNDSESVDSTTIYTYLKKDGTEYVVASPVSNDSISISPYYFFPDTDAYQQVIVQYSEDELVTLKEIPLTSHSLLNGAYYFEGFDETLSDYSEIPATTDSSTAVYQSSIYTSYVMNPFIFPPELINTVGTGSISALSSATKAISEGQFGQFPLHAFTTEGIWALELSESGGYTSCQPITRDVIKGEQVLQLEQSLIFPTEKGIITLSGGESNAITTSLDGKFNPTRLSRLTELLTITNHDDLILPDIEFSEFVEDSLLTYDNINSRIYISNEKYGYSYIYSQISQAWSCISYAFSNNISNYSSNLITMVDENSIESIYKLNGSEITDKSLIITRPIKLGLLNQYKSLSSIVTQGILEQSSERVATALYASIDGLRYIPIATSTTEKILGIQGSPYKYFILVQPLSLNEDESINGVEMAFESRKIDKLH